jgi:hypothetical protein
VSGTCSTHGRGIVCVCRGGGGEEKERDQLEDEGVNVRMGSGWILGRLDGGVWI